MRLLLDACVWGGAIPILLAAGHNVEWVGDWREDPGDANILEYAFRTEQVLVTLDKDFGELAVLHQQPNFGIIRLVNWSAQQQSEACLGVLERYGEELLRGALVTAEPGRARIRSAEQPDHESPI